MLGLNTLFTIFPITQLIDSLFAFVLAMLFIPSIISFGINSINSLISLLMPMTAMAGA